MLRQLGKNKIAQNTAEYALLIALVVAAVIAMQTYAQRGLQSGMRDVTTYMATSRHALNSGIGNTVQYEPYYQQTNYDVERNSESYTRLAEGTSGKESSMNRTRAENGEQVSTYNSAVTLGANGAMVNGI